MKPKNWTKVSGILEFPQHIALDGCGQILGAAGTHTQMRSFINGRGHRRQAAANFAEQLNG